MIADLFLPGRWKAVNNNDERYWQDASTGFVVPTSVGGYIDPSRAMTITTLYACYRVIVTAIASMPLITYRRVARGKERATDHPLYSVLHDRPNRWQTAVEWVEMMTGHALLRGRGVSIRVPGRRGAVGALVPVHPDRVKARMTDSGDLVYDITDWQTGRTQRYLQSEVFVLPGMGGSIIEPMSYLLAQAAILNSAKSAQEVANEFWEKGIVASGILSYPGSLKPEQKTEVKKELAEKHAGLGRRWRVMVLEQGMEWKQLTMAAKDMQFLESRKFDAEQICATLGVPPHMVGLMDAATFSNIEHQSLEFVTFCLRPWMTRWRQSIQRDLISESDRDIFAEHLPDDLLRGDVKGRYEAYKIAIDAGWMHRNEVRERENLNTVEGLDKFLESQNTRPAGSDTGTGQALLLAEDDDAVMRAVTDKIATRFANTIGKRADKQGADPQRFKVWAIGELEKQQARTAFDLRAAGMDEDRARAVAGEMVDHALNWLERDETAEQVIAAWRSVLGAELREITKNGVAHAEH